MFQALLAVGLVLLVAPLASVAEGDSLAMADTSKVTCGSTIKLMHSATKARLHSHDISYGSGSGQQSVTGFPTENDANGYWTVKPAFGEKCAQGEVLKSGTVFRLQHVKTRKWLHSHNHQSPITQNQEVSCYGGEEESNAGDNWRLELSDAGGEWKRDQKVRIVHTVTNTFLHSHQHKFGRPISGQHEVCGSKSRDNNNFWSAAEGIYMPVRGSDEL